MRFINLAGQEDLMCPCNYDRRTWTPQKINIFHQDIQLQKKSLDNRDKTRRRQSPSRQSRKETEASLKDVSLHYAAAGFVKCVSKAKKEKYSVSSSFPCVSISCF